MDATGKLSARASFGRDYLSQSKNSLGLSPVLYDVDAADAVSARNLVQVAEQLQRLLLYGAVGLVRHLYITYVQEETQPFNTYPDNSRCLSSHQEDEETGQR